MKEIGPGMLTYDGKVIFFGAANSGGQGKTAVYSPSATPTGTGTWTAGPDIPKVGGQAMVCNDCPAVDAQRQRVGRAAKFMTDTWGFPILFFEYDQPPTPSRWHPRRRTTESSCTEVDSCSTPNGEVLFSARSNNIQVYTPNGGPEEPRSRRSPPWYAWVRATIYSRERG